MNLLVLNSGSSSIKFSGYVSGESDGQLAPRLIFSGEVTGVGTAKVRFQMKAPGGELESNGDAPADTILAAGRLVLETVCRPGMPPIDAVGYRVVHPGAKLRSHTRIDHSVLEDLKNAVLFAPLHDPAVITLIEEGMAQLPHIAHYACFDTVFHQTMPQEATTYPIPAKYRRDGVKRYGFHGLSCESVLHQLRSSGRVFPDRLAIAHLGSGCSVTALLEGQSIDTSMGLTPTGGVIMGTRPGDLDPGLLLYLLRQQSGGEDDKVSALEMMLNHDSGLVGLTELPNDMRALREVAGSGNPLAVLALNVFTRSIRKAIGSFSWVLGGLDAIVFTGGIGEHDARTRSEVLDGLGALGVIVEPELNTQQTDGLRTISTEASRTTVLVIPAREDLTIAVHVLEMART